VVACASGGRVAAVVTQKLVLNHTPAALSITYTALTTQSNCEWSNF